MKKIILILVCLIFTLKANASTVQNLSAEDALKRLREGNNNFKSLKLIHPHQSAKDRMNLTKGQHPFVVVLTCSDSRVPPEIIFDQGLGDIFEIRNAGNVLDSHIIGSIEYAVMHLGVNLVVVMGHEDCGAVTAAYKGVNESKFINSLINSIKPAMKKCQKTHTCNCTLPDVIKENAVMNAEKITKQDEALKLRTQKNGLKIIPAYYHLDSGEVEFFE